MAPTYIVAKKYNYKGDSAMKNYEELLNSRKGKTPISIQPIYDVVYAPDIDEYTLKNFSRSMQLMDSAVTADGKRVLVQFKRLGQKEENVMILTQVDPQLREVMVFCFRFMHKVRDANQSNDYAHLGITGQRLYGETNLTVPGSGRRAGDLSEFAVAIREKLKLYEQ